MPERAFVIIANGDELNKSLYQQIVPSGFIVVAADGGANICQKADIQPDVLIGDFDSVEPEILNAFPKSKIIHRPSQYMTDMEKAIDYVLGNNADKILIFSALGQRSDHTLGNLQFFQSLKLQIPLEIYDNFGRLRLLPAGKHELKYNSGQIVSIISFRPICNLELSGFKYSIPKQEWRDSFMGISNVCQKETCVISFEAGSLFLYELLESSDESDI